MHSYFLQTTNTNNYVILSLISMFNDTYFIIIFTYISFCNCKTYFRMDNGIYGLLYVRTPSGVCKILQIIFSLCAFISMMVFNSQWSVSEIVFFELVTIFGFIYSLLILIGSFLNVGSSTNETWHKIDLLTSVILSILIFSSATFFTPYFPGAYHSLRSGVIFQYMNGFAYFGNIAMKIFQ